MQRYGAPWVSPRSQVVGARLTVRGHRELPTMLHFDASYCAAVGEKWWVGFVASLAMVEWLTGMPPGWTSVKPLAVGVSTAAYAAAALLGGPESAPDARTLSLFSGWGSLYFGLLVGASPLTTATHRTTPCEFCKRALAIAPCRPEVSTRMPGASRPLLRAARWAGLSQGCRARACLPRASGRASWPEDQPRACGLLTRRSLLSPPWRLLPTSARFLQSSPRCPRL